MRPSWLWKWRSKVKSPFVLHLTNRLSDWAQILYAYGTAKKKRPGYLVGNLVATNWPIEKALHAIGYNQIPTK